jgi:CBS domain-containing protein
MTTSVRQVLEAKGATTLSLPPSATVYEALEVMAKNDVGSVVVADGDCLLGMFTERDYARKLILQGRSSKDTRVSELMTSNILTVSPTQTIEDCMEMITDNRVRHLPVVEKGRLVGIISIGDVVKAVIADQQRTIQQLSSYIAGDISS